MNLVAARTRASHESAHCASLLFFGHVPELVRTDYPTDDRAGSMRMPWDQLDPGNPADLEIALISVLQGPISEGFVPQAHHWPIGEGWPDTCASDALQAAHLVERLDLGAVDLGRVLHKASAIWESRRFRELYVAVMRELEDKELLLRHELDRIASEVPA